MKTINKIAIIGPECTGKTTLAIELSDHFNTEWIPEFAREYIEGLDRPYDWKDLELIAQRQKEQINGIHNNCKHFVFYDTDLIITKVWFEVVYQKVPEWIDLEIKNSNFSLYLLCDTDISWTADKVRENGGDMRDILFDKYKLELEKYGFKYRIISGLGEARLNNALKIIGEHLKN